MKRPPTAMEAAVMVGLSLVLAQLTYTYVEQPFRYGRQGRYRGSPLAHAGYLCRRAGNAGCGGVAL